MQNIRKKGILYTSTGATRKFQSAGVIQDPTLNTGTNAGNMLRKVSGYGKNLLKNSQTWGDGSRTNARRQKQYDAKLKTLPTVKEYGDAVSTKLSGDYGGYFKNQSNNIKSPTFESPSFKATPNQMLSPNNYSVKDGQLINSTTDVTTAAGKAFTKPTMDAANAGIDAIGSGATAASSLIKPPAVSGGFSGNVGVYSAAGNMAGSALQSIDDGKDYNYSNAEKAGTVGGTALKGAAMGASVGAMFGGVGAPIGAVAGAVVGTVAGFVKKGQEKREAKKALAKKTTNETNRADAVRMNDLLTQEQNMAASPLSTMQSLPAAQGQYARYETGGTFEPLKFNESTAANRIIKKKAADVLTPKKFKRGGSIKPTENIIPAGVLHEEDNDLGDKGMPVVKCKDNACEKKYEIEKDEMIFTLSATKQTEELVGKKDYSKLGKFVKAQILDNTHSFTDKYKDLNNM